MRSTDQLGASSASRWSPLSTGRRSRAARVALVVGMLVLVALPTGFSAAGARTLSGNHSTAADSVAGPSGTASGGSSSPSATSLTDSMDWAPLTPPAPLAVAGAGFATFSEIGSGVLFGGEGSAGLLNITYLYNETQNTWTPTLPAPAPTPRSDFGFATVPGSSSAVLFGGQVNEATGAVANDTWLFQFSSDVWTNLSGGVAPAPRQDPAFAVGDGVALLFGGWVQNVSGTGELTYSDTWVLNLTTDLWTRVSAFAGPGTLHGADLVWQPSLDEFLLFGGCYPCSSAVWAFSPATLAWTAVFTSGTSPPARMDAVWAWDPVAGEDILFGGTNGTAIFDDTYYFDPASTSWTLAATSQVPDPRYSAAADYLAVPGNATLLLTGGTSGATLLSDTWRLSAVGNLTVVVTNATSGVGIANATVEIGSGGVLLSNATGYATALGLPSGPTTVTATQAGYAEGFETLWLPPGSTVEVPLELLPLAPANASVTVVNPDGAPVAGAQVSLYYGSQLLPGGPHLTDAGGACEITDIPSAIYRVDATHTGYHPSSLEVDFVPGVTTFVRLNLSPLFSLSVRALGVLPNATVAPLDGAEIVVAGAATGTTDPSGYFNTTLTQTGLLRVTASLYAYVNSTALVNVTYTGAAYENLTLNARPFPTVTLEILGQRGSGPGIQVRNATVLVQSTTPLPTGPYSGNFTTDVEGTVTFSPPAGNYSVRVSAPGFLPNDSVPVIYAPPDTAIGRTIYLQLIPFSNIEVLVLSTAPGNPPVGHARFFLNFSGVNLSDGLPYPSKTGESLSTGWANFSGIPDGTTFWTVLAPGYQAANGTFAVVYGSPTNQFTIYLVPIPPPRYTGLDIFPAAPNAIWSLVLLPIACLVGALVYLTMLRNPSSRERELRETAQATRGGLDSTQRR